MMKDLLPAAARGLAPIMLIALAGCVADTVALAPSSADQPWLPGDGNTVDDMRAQAQASGALALSGPLVDEKRVYSLPQLIDLAQRTNPDTRVAWEQARQAALAVGMAEATYLPVITANVIGGSNSNSAALPIPIGGTAYFNSNIEAWCQFMALQWLAFDFGGRSAVVEGAKKLSLASNYQFNAIHQKLIFRSPAPITTTTLHAPNNRAASQALANSRTVKDAINARRERGLATSVDLAQAEQLVAQSELRVVQARGSEQDAYQMLLGAIGISPMSKLKIEDTNTRKSRAPRTFRPKP